MIRGADTIGSDRLLQVDLLKGAAIIAVVLLHAMTRSQQIAYQTAFFIAQAVPVFFLLMAFNAKRSFDRRFEGATLLDIYRSGQVCRRLLRLTLPLGVAVAVSVVGGIMSGRPLYFGWLSLLLRLPVPLRGNFFVAVSIAFALLAPLLFVAYRKNSSATVIMCVVLDLGFEILATQVPLFASTYYIYQVIPLRFIALFGLGMWLGDDARPTSRRNWFIVPCALASVGYLVAYAFGLRTAFLDREHMYNILAFGYPLLIVSAGLTWLPRSTTGAVLNAVAELGMASYHIFLVQAVWFAFGVGGLQRGDPGWVLLSVVACCGAGWAWFHLGRLWRRRGDSMGARSRRS